MEATNGFLRNPKRWEPPIASDEARAAAAAEQRRNKAYLSSDRLCARYHGELFEAFTCGALRSGKCDDVHEDCYFAAKAFRRLLVFVPCQFDSATHPRRMCLTRPISATTSLQYLRSLRDSVQTTDTKHMKFKMQIK
eukprot:TRINITY_DN76578_c0_g1_i1.p1 TRINITY_DN76578_c0_g1~~TRINITY_DN76578_c0_g1_i1.p1  ORF type:complete len:137 (-),score=11.11 TRINITY_DN76578_c0_g1_i1:385-795(-)